MKFVIYSFNSFDFSKSFKFIKLIYNIFTPLENDTGKIFTIKNLLLH